MIVKVDPARWQDVNVVQIDSDAADNMSAIREIEDWAADRGFARTVEYHLRRAKLKGGPTVFRSICYRLTEEETAAAEHSNAEVAERIASMPATPHMTNRAG